jgi:hypothetical protein
VYLLFLLESECKVKHFSSNANEKREKNALPSVFFLKKKGKARV